MATNFKILVHRNSQSLHLKLLGDFDRASAYELLEIINRNAGSIRRIFIHTNGIRQVYSFGKDVFQNNLARVDHNFERLTFTGESADKIAPDFPNDSDGRTGSSH